MPAVSIRVIGDDLLAAEFLAAAESARERLTEAGKPVADAIADTQRQLVRKRSMKTHDSISVDPGEGATVYEVGATTFYARFLEMGTAKMQPFPFAGPSADLHESAWVAVASDVAGDV